MRNTSILLVATTCMLAVGASATAGELDRLFKRVVDQVKDQVLSDVQTKAVDAVTRPAGEAIDGDSAASDPGPDQASARGYTAPRADVRIDGVPQTRWLTPSIGRKFESAQGKPQIIATNPYLSPERPMFAAMRGMQCARDGSLVVAGRAGMSAEGYAIGEGWWRIAPDGAITPIVSHPVGSRRDVTSDAPFGVAADGTLLTSSNEGVFRIDSTGRAKRISAAGERFQNPGAPVEDDQGNLWVADEGSGPGTPYCAVRRIAPDGRVSTVVDTQRICSSEQHPKDRINLHGVAWDSTHGELVAHGYNTDTSHGDRNMHITVWRIRPDGQARRVLYTVKIGRSPVGQNTDAISSLIVDAQGRIVVGSRLMGGNARRQLLRVDEDSGRMVALTGSAYGFGDHRPGHEESPVDGAAAHANFREARALCVGDDGTVFALDEHLVRRLDRDGQVRTWVY